MYTLVQAAEIPVHPIAVRTAGQQLQAAIRMAETARAAAAVGAPGAAARVAAARVLQRAIVDIESRIGSPDYQNSPQLQAILDRARDEVRQELEADAAPVAVPPATPLTNLIARLPSDKVRQLERILMTMNGAARNAALLDLFPLPLATPIATDWRQFCTNYTIQNLGGNNIKNFLVRPILGAAPMGAISEVLKLEWRFNFPRRIDEVVHAIPAVSAHLAPSHGPIMVPSAAPNGTPCGRTIMVTGLLPNGDFMEYAARTNPSTIDSWSGMPYGEGARPPAAHVARTINLCQQMGQAFADMETNQLFFPDAKGTNWLVDAAGHLKIADTKSLLRTNAMGMYDPNLPDNAGTSTLSTRGFLSHTIGALPIPADPRPIHSALLGRNIYLALTNDWPPRAPRDDGQVILPAAINHWPHFAELNALVQSLTDPNPALRPTVAEATTCLNQIAAFNTQITDLNTLTGSDYTALLTASIQQELAAGHTITQAVANVHQILNEAITEATDGNTARGILNASTLGATTPFPAALCDTARTARTTGAVPPLINLTAVRDALRAHTADLHQAQTLFNDIQTKITACNLRTLRGAPAHGWNVFRDGIANRIQGATLADRLTAANTVNGSLTTTRDTLQRIETKLAILNKHTKIDCSALLLASLDTANTNRGYSTNQELDQALNDVEIALDNALVHAQNVALHTSEIEGWNLMFGTGPLLPEFFLYETLTANAAGMTNLANLSTILQVHDTQLQNVLDPMMKASIETLCRRSMELRAIRFGAGDDHLMRFLEQEKRTLHTAGGIPGLLANVAAAQQRLDDVYTGLNDATNQAIHRVINRLRREGGEKNRSKADSIEQTVAQIPLNVRRNLHGNFGDPTVQAMLRTLDLSTQKRGRLFSRKHASATDPNAETKNMTESAREVITALRASMPPPAARAGRAAG